MDRFPEKTSSTRLVRGLYVLRYIESQSAAAPHVYLRAADERALKIIFPPDVNSSSLQKPGSALVILAEAAADVHLTVRASVPGGSVDATLRVEPLHATASSEPKSAEIEPRRPLPEFELIGHVARRGDISAARGTWVAGPDAPAPIEGIEVSWPAKSDVGIEYQVMARGAAWSEWMLPGQYAGTKGLAMALAGVRFRLVGPDAGHYLIKSSAVFLGSAENEQSGQHVELRSVAGHDPLVGLKVDVVAVQRQPAGLDPARAAPQRSAGERRGRVRVFRAGVEQQTS